MPAVGQAGQRIDLDHEAELAMRSAQLGDAALVVHDQRKLRHEQGHGGRSEQGAQRRVGAGQSGREGEEGEAEPCYLEQGAASQADQQALQDRRGGEVFEARDGEAGVQRHDQHGAGEHVGRARPVEGRQPGADRRDRCGSEHEPVGPRRDGATAAREEASHPGQGDDRPLQREGSGKRREQDVLVLERMGRQRGGEPHVGHDPPPHAAARALLNADRCGGGTGKGESGRDGHEQGRRVKQHREILGSSLASGGSAATHGARACGKTVTNWQVPAGLPARRPAGGA